MKNTLLIRRPAITEKATSLGTLGKYVFIVSPSATKPEVKKVIAEMYKVEVRTVNIVNRPAKKKRFRGVRGRKPGYKKAIVTLRTGQRIDFGQ